jgi:hypothetical protein
MAKLRVLPSGKLYVRNGKLSAANCCCDPPAIPTCDYGEFNSAIVSSFVGGASSASMLTGGDFGPLSYTVTDDHNGRELEALSGRFNVSPRTSYIDEIGSQIYAVDTEELYEKVWLACSGGTSEPLPDADPTGVSSQLWYFHQWDLIFFGTICEQKVWVSESGQAFQQNSGSGLFPITGSMNVLSKNPLHILVEFEPIDGTYPSDTNCDDVTDPAGVVYVEITE